MKLLRLPHPLVLLTGCVLLGALASHLAPPGEFERHVDPESGRTLVVAGTYHRVERNAVSPFGAVVALPRGMADAAEVVFLVLLIGGAFTVVDETGAFRRAVASLVAALGSRTLPLVPLVCLLFAAAGAAENMKEEIIALIPVLLILARRVGFTPVVAVAMSAGSAFVGAAFSPINPFQVQIAQNLAELPLGSGAVFRLVFLVLALVLWIGGTMRYAARTRVPAERFETAEPTMTVRDRWILLLVTAAFGMVVWGSTSQGWGFNELSALFFIVGVAAGLFSGLGLEGTVAAYIQGFRGMAYAAVLIGFARAIFVVLQDGHIVDTLVYGLFLPLEHLPLVLSAIGMLVAQAVLHVPVPSVTGQAVLTVPILVPLSDLLGMSRQVTVLAYQYGAGLGDLVTPTNGALVAILSVAGLRIEQWWRFVLPLYGGLMALGAVAIGIAIVVGI